MTLPEETSEAEPVDDARVESCVSELESALESFQDESDSSDEEIDQAVLVHAVQRAVDAGYERDEFLLLLAEMFDESVEMGDIEKKMSLTRGEA